MTKAILLRVACGVLAATTFAAIGASAEAQSLTPAGKAYGGWYKGSGGEQWVAAATLPADGSIGTTESTGDAVAGKLSTGTSTSVTSGMTSVDRTGAQSVASVQNVNLLGGAITASRVIAISMISQVKGKAIIDADGSTIEGLTVNGAAMASPAANTRVDLPGLGYAVFNEQVKGKGRGNALTVNMIHVYLQDGSEIVIGSAMASTGG